ncbi:MAG: hypothetical protein HC941_30710 [Microcoleus sp. SU_5_3]|nr:hypothetical protein [Microcoleus sp. SU_5_3]
MNKKLFCIRDNCATTRVRSPRDKKSKERSPIDKKVRGDRPVSEQRKGAIAFAVGWV